MALRHAWLLLVVGGVAWAAPPTGKRTARPVATHVVTRDVVIEAPGVRALVAMGTPVARKAGAVTTVGDVEVSGKTDGAALGLLVARDVEALSADGREPVGTLHAGTMVTLAAARAPRGRVLVDAVGPIKARLSIPADALTAAPRELVYPNAGRPQVVARFKADIFATPEARGVRAQAAEGAAFWVLDEAVDKPVAKVRTFGGVAIEGWVLKTKLAAGTAAPLPLPQRATPTHELLVDGPMVADPRGGKPVARLRGGALVTVAPGQDVTKAAWVRVRTREPVVVEGWARGEDLRPLEASVWSEP